MEEPPKWLSQSSCQTPANQPRCFGCIHVVACVFATWNNESRSCARLAQVWLLHSQGPTLGELRSTPTENCRQKPSFQLDWPNTSGFCLLGRDLTERMMPTPLAHLGLSHGSMFKRRIVSAFSRNCRCSFAKGPPGGSRCFGNVDLPNVGLWTPPFTWTPLPWPVFVHIAAKHN